MYEGKVFPNDLNEEEKLDFMKMIIRLTWEMDERMWGHKDPHGY